MKKYETEGILNVIHLGISRVGNFKLKPKPPKKVIKTFGLSEQAVNKLEHLKKKTGLSASNIVEQIVLAVEL